MTCINRGSLPTRRGSRSLKSREPLCYRHWHGRIPLSLRGFFPFRFFMYFYCFAIGFFCDLATLTSLFWWWIDSLEITHYIWCFHWELNSRSLRSLATNTPNPSMITSSYNDHGTQEHLPSWHQCLWGIWSNSLLQRTACPNGDWLCDDGWMSTGRRPIVSENLSPSTMIQRSASARR